MDNMTALGENNGTVPELAQQGNTGEKSVTPPDAGEDRTTGAQAPNQAADRRAAWQALVDGEYKDLFTQDTQRIINARFKQVKGLEQQLSDAREVLELAMGHFGIDDGDVDKLKQAIADRRHSRAETHRRAEAFARAQVERWGQEEKRLKEDYPDFDLKREMAGEDFRALVTNPRRPVSLRAAYEATHMERIKQQVARRQAQATERRVVDSIRARGTRPDENGTSGQSGFTVREDVSRLTDRQLADIRRRVMSGERISFG